AGDPEAARAAMRAHLAASQERYRSLLSGQQAKWLSSILTRKT
ncbi:FadR family transcriptional regulator, partial [Rhizobium johnstonii]